MKKTEIIAEIGQAHDGSLGILHSYIDAIAGLDIDTIKFQMHIADYESSIYDDFRKKFSYEDKTRLDYWKRMTFDIVQWTEIFDHCNQLNLNVLCSPFSIKAIELLESLNLKRYKVASGEITNTLMIDALIETKKPVLLSSGLSTLKEIEFAVKRLLENGIDTSLFQCTTAYPSDATTIGINNIHLFKEKYNIPIGLSDHSGTIYPSLCAVGAGAELIEVHATFDKKIFGPDSSSSLDLKELKQLTEGIRFTDKMLNNPVIKDSFALENHDLKIMFGKSLTVNKNLKVGDILNIKDLETTKPGNQGIDACNYKNIIGKKMIKAIDKHGFLKDKYFE